MVRLSYSWHFQTLSHVLLVPQIVPLAYIAGLSLVPRQFYQERQQTMPGGINYIALSDGANSPLLPDGAQDEGLGIYAESAGQYRHTRLSMDEVEK